MKCVIIEDDEQSLNALLQLTKQVRDISVEKVYSDAKDAMHGLTPGDIDFILLDIELPGMNGIDLLSSLNWAPPVIFTTSNPQYAQKAFELNVVDYLMKPISLPRFVRAVSKVKEVTKTDNEVAVNVDWVFIKNKSVFERVYHKDILWMQALGDYIKINTRNQMYVVHTTLKSLETKLPRNKYVRVHKSFIIQIENIKTVEDTTIYVQDMAVPIGNMYKEEFIKKINLLQ